MNHEFTRREFGILGVSLAAALGLGACSSNATGGASPGGAGASDIFAGAPVADAALITAGSFMEKIKKAGVLKVGAALDAPLLSQQDPTNPDSVSGFDATLAKLLATYIIGKPSIKIIPPASETREALLKNGTVDVVFNTYTITAQRATQIQFAGPYFLSGLAIATAATNTAIKSPADLNGKTVIVGANTPAVEAVPKVAPSAKVISFATDPEAVAALAQGRGDAYVQDFILLATNAKADPKIKVVGTPFTEEPYGIGLPPNDAAFKQFVNDWLTKIETGGQWKAAYQQSLGTVVQGDAPAPPKLGSVAGS